jgi:ankyrin repeat protein
VQVLVEAGAKLDRRTRVEGATPLYLATKISNLAIVEFLISKGADFVLPTHQVRFKHTF